MHDDIQRKVVIIAISKPSTRLQPEKRQLPMKKIKVNFLLQLNQLFLGAATDRKKATQDHIYKTVKLSKLRLCTFLTQKNI